MSFSDSFIRSIYVSVMYHLYNSSPAIRNPRRLLLEFKIRSRIEDGSICESRAFSFALRIIDIVKFIDIVARDAY